MSWFDRLKEHTAVQLIAALRLRLQLFDDNGDPSAVLGRGALGEAKRLWAVTERSGSIDPTPLGLDALETLARLHWARSRAALAGIPPSRDGQATAARDLDEAVRLFEQLGRHAPDRVPPSVAVLVEQARRPSADDELDAQMGDKLIDKYEGAVQALTAAVKAGGGDSLNTAVDGFERALALAPPGHPICPVVLSNLCGALRMRAELTDSPEDADRAVEAGRQSMVGLAADHPDRPSLAFNLAVALRLRSERHAGSPSASADDIDEAVALLRQAASRCSPGEPSYPSIQSHLGVCLRIRSAATANRTDAHDAVTACEIAVQRCSRPDPQRGIYGMELASARMHRYLLIGEGADLDVAITEFREGLRYIPYHHPSRGTALSNLATALRIRFSVHARLEDLDTALQTARQGLEAAGPHAADHALHLSNLSLCLLAHHTAIGDEESLDAAVDAARQSVEAVAAGDQRRAGYLVNLSDLHLTRFRLSENASDLQAAVGLAEDALAAMPDSHAWRGAAVSGLSNALLRRFQNDGDPHSLERARDLARASARHTPPGNASRVSVLVNLANLLLIRIEHNTNDAGTGDEDLQEAVNAAGGAVNAAHASPADLPGCLATLGRALALRADSNGDDTLRDQAIDTFTRAVELTPPDHPRRPQRLNRLARLLTERFQTRHDSGDLQRALHLWQQATAVTTAPAEDRLLAAAAWGTLAGAVGQFDTAVEAFSHAVTLLPLAAWHGLAPATRAERLARWSGITADAGACAVRAGRPQVAVELLEQGRSILWNHGLNLRTPLDDLAHVAPELAGRLNTLRRALDVPLHLGSDPDHSARIDPALPTPTAQTAQASPQDHRPSFAREYDRLVDQARHLDGFERFMLTPSFAQLRGSADHGPVALVNVSEFGSHALIVTSGQDVQVVDLPELTPQNVAASAATLTRALADRTSDPLTDGPMDFGAELEREHNRRAGLATFAWLWDNIAAPVLNRPELANCPDLTNRPDHRRPDERLPRLWWCPSGPLALLPLHAAGRYPETIHARCQPDECVPARAVTSYMPTLQALQRVRTAPPPPGPPRQLVVGMPVTAGHADLPRVSAELAALARHFPHPEHADHLLPPEATTARALECLRRCSWVHLACHAEQDPDDAARSGFALFHGTLTVSALSRENIHGDLAFLSACETSAGDARLPDEALHLAGAMHFIGYRHVIATMWPIEDVDAPEVADAVYGALTREGHPKTDPTAHALHEALERLRRDHPADPLRWASYVHYGP